MTTTTGKSRDVHGDRAADEHTRLLSVETTEQLRRSVSGPQRP